MSEPWRLSLSDGLRKIEEGGLSASEWARSLLERIDALDGKLLAWAHVDREGALAGAKAIDERIADGQGSGALGGAAIGFKDIVDVVGLPREANSPLLKGYIADEDATVTTRLKNAGALCLGKTVTTQFATSDPSETRNPWNFKRSPGGSSSGSAAAVATGMVPAALGSQTGGSTLRPSAFCGVVGLKPTYGRIPRSGLITVSWESGSRGRHYQVRRRCGPRSHGDLGRRWARRGGARCRRARLRRGLQRRCNTESGVFLERRSPPPREPKRWPRRIEECVAGLKA